MEIRKVEAGWYETPDGWQILRGDMFGASNASAWYLEAPDDHVIDFPYPSLQAAIEAMREMRA